MQVFQRVALACAVVLVACVTGCGDDPLGAAGTGGGGYVPPGVVCGGFTCMVGQTCVNNVCTNPCTMDTECAGSACCAQVCVPTAADRNNCGGCGIVCAATELCTAGVCTGVTCNTPAPLPEPGDDGGVDDDAGVDLPTTPPIGTNGCPQNEQCAVSGNAGVCQCGASPSCPDDQPCGTDSACHCGAAAACTTGSTCCGGTTCANLLSSALNCGACGVACPTGQTCSNGSCGCATTSETVCDDGCHNLQSDKANCGSCGNACPSEASCNNGKCVCPTPGEIGCGTECVAPNTNEHCGGCGGCPNSGSGGASCQDLDGDDAFECSCSSDEQEECAGKCTFLTTNTNCGACGNGCESGKTSCKDDGDGSVACLCAAFPDEQLCDDGVDTSCVDVLGGDETNCGGCGITCPATGTCTNGVCSCPVPPAFAGDIFCDRGGASDPADYACESPIDNSNCFACGNACPSGSNCNASDMDCRCTDNTKSFCDGACIDTDSDLTHCGDCDTECAAANVCDAGKCCPNATPDNCNNVCLDTKTDENNCGTCGHVCGGAETCCGGSCIDTDESDANCGSCGAACPGTGCGLLGFFPCTCGAGTCG